MQKLQESGPFDKFTAAGRTGDLDFSLPYRDTDFLSAMRTAVDFVCFGIADHTFVPFAEPGTAKNMSLSTLQDCEGKARSKKNWNATASSARSQLWNVPMLLLW